MNDELSVLAERFAREDRVRIFNVRCKAILLMKEAYLTEFDPKQLGAEQIKSELDVLAVHYDSKHITGDLYRMPADIKSKVDPATRKHTELFGQLARKRFDLYTKLYPWEDLVSRRTEFDFRLSKVATAQAILELGGEDWIDHFKNECAQTGINWLHKARWIHQDYHPLLEKFYWDFFTAEAKGMEILQTN